VAQISKVKELDRRIRALAAESEAYRQLLGLEVQNLRLQGNQFRQQVRRWTSHPLFRLLPLLGGLRSEEASPLANLFGKQRRPGWARWISVALKGWRIYRRIQPVLQSLRAGRPTQSPAGNPGTAGKEISGAI
jgi:hypothetical protein